VAGLQADGRPGTGPRTIGGRAHSFGLIMWTDVTSASVQELPQPLQAGSCTSGTPWEPWKAFQWTSLLDSPEARGLMHPRVVDRQGNRTYDPQPS